MIDDAVLSREASLIYQYVFGFEPVQGNLTMWKGSTKDKSGQLVEVKIQIPENYPNEPPICTVDRSVSHPNVDDGRFTTRSLSRWTSDIHVYQIIKEIQQVVSHSFIQTSAASIAPSQMDNVMERQIQYLKDQLIGKKAELDRLSTSKSEFHNKAQTLSNLKQDKLIDIQNELYSLEDSYDRLDLGGMEFSKKFLELRKRYYMIKNAA